MKKFYIIFALVAVAVNIDAAKRCSPVPVTPSPTCEKRNEEWGECGFNPCEATCDDPEKPMKCKIACSPGCGCKAGYLRDANGNCIRQKQCPQKLTCGENEDYHQCSTLCGEKTCANREDRYCGLGCQERCLCKEGYIRDENKRCIKVEECPIVDPPVPICSKNHEEYNECGTACPLTCDSPPNQICTKQCVAGCFCETGYVRDKNGECILQSECPKPACPSHEVYSECGANGCQNTCANPTLSQVCRAVCTAGCICEEGYIRNANGKCVLPTQCNECSPHEVWTDCNFFCGNKYCDFLINPVACKPAGCTSGCICEDGYYRDSNEVCVPENSCPV